MNILEKNFFKLREKMLEKFKVEFEKHKELGEGEVPIKSFGPINGVYHERGNKSYFIRPRIRAGVISLEQLKGISDIANLYGDGEIKLTTRHGIQIRGIKEDKVYDVLEELKKYDLYTQAVGGKSIRGMVVSSFSGFEKEEFDIIPYAIKSIDYMFQNEDTYLLPGKLKFAASNNEEDTANAKYSDMGFIAKNINGEKFFEVYFDFGMNLSMKNPYKYSKLIKAEEMVYYMRATTMMFKDNMDMKNPRARLRTMNRLIGLENFEDKYNEYLEKAKIEVNNIVNVKELYSKENLEKAVNNVNFDKKWAQKIDFENANLKKYELKNIKESFYEEGIYAIKLKYPGGIMKKGELQILVEHLESISHEVNLRFTNKQDIIIFNLNGNEILEIIKKFNDKLVKTDLEDTITCTGIPRCRLALTSSKVALDKILKYFKQNSEELMVELPQLRISGCPNSCSLTFKGDLGFSGRLKSVGEKKKNAYTLLSENENIISRGKAVILEEDLPKLLFEIAEYKKNTKIESFNLFLNKEYEKVNKIIEKYM